VRRSPGIGSVLLLACGAVLFPGRCADPFYLGTWRIASAVVAPWTDPKFPPDEAAKKSYVGKTMTIEARQISGPGLLPCKGPNYRVVEVPAEGLFQGAFDEMHRRNPSADALELAHKVGFRGSSWKSLQTGCANELDFHFVDPSTAEFGLNDWVFTMRKQ